MGKLRSTGEKVAIKYHSRQVRSRRGAGSAA
jgi:hypothetical protein